MVAILRHRKGDVKVAKRGALRAGGSHFRLQHADAPAVSRASDVTSEFEEELRTALGTLVSRQIKGRNQGPNATPLSQFECPRTLS